MKRFATKLTALFLAAFIIIGSAPLSGAAELNLSFPNWFENGLFFLKASAEDGIDYEYSISNGNATITRYTGSGGAVTIPAEIEEHPVTNIGTYAFYNCTRLISVTIGNSVLSIGNNAFYKCTGLKSVTLGSGVTNIGDLAFAGCNCLTGFTVAEGNTVYISNSGVLYNKAKSRLVQYPGGKSDSYTIPAGVTSIGNNAFYLCTGLKSITFGNSVTNIGDYAFYQCTGLTSITIPNSVTKIWNSVFESCTSLASIAISNSVTSIGYRAFYDTAWYKNQSNGLIYAGKVAYEYKGIMPPNTAIEIIAGSKGIGDSAFRNCTGLTSITIPNSMFSIEFSAFSGCTGLTSVNIPNSITSIKGSAFSGCAGLTSIIIPNSVTSIGELAFAECGGLTSAAIPNSVISIGDWAFLECDGLTIYGKSGSGAEKYANMDGISFVPVPDDVLTPVTGSGFVVDNAKGYILGLPSGIMKTQFEQYVQLKSGYTLGYSTEDFGTGTEVYIISNSSESAGDAVESFTIITFGDINGDGLITVIDALMTLQKACNEIAFSPAQSYAGDVSKNGLISSLDALKILQFASGKITCF